MPTSVGSQPLELRELPASPSGRPVQAGMAASSSAQQAESWKRPQEAIAWGWAIPVACSLVKRWLPWSHCSESRLIPRRIALFDPALSTGGVPATDSGTWVACAVRAGGTAGAPMGPNAWGPLPSPPKSHPTHLKRAAGRTRLRSSIAYRGLTNSAVPAAGPLGPAPFRHRRSSSIDGEPVADHRQGRTREDVGKPGGVRFRRVAFARHSGLPARRFLQRRLRC